MASVLVVDDSRTSRKILRGIFEEAGFLVIGEACDGDEAVEMYKKLKPDAVSMDITMPGKNGMDALQEIKSLDENAKVIMVTSINQKSKMTEAVKIGATDFVTKPFQSDHVIEVFQKATASS